MTEPFFTLQPTEAPNRWRLPVTPELSVGPPERLFLFGGVGLAAALSVLELRSGRPALWVTAQYTSFAAPGSVLEFEAQCVDGKQTSQARTSARVGDRPVIYAVGALGERPGDNDQWVAAPAVPPPDDCPVVSRNRGGRATVTGLFETRLARGRSPAQGEITTRGADGKVVLWARLKERRPLDRVALAILADFLPVGLSHAVGGRANGNSLDNTIRFGVLEPETEWVLLDLQIEAMLQGIVHGRIRLFSERGTLMATAAQSMILRRHRPAAKEA
jgi:acyl-CoA thioesterase II